MAGLKIESSSHNRNDKGEAFQVLASSDADPLAIADYFAKALKDKGFDKVQRSEQKAGDTAMVALSVNDKSVNIGVTVMRDATTKKSAVTIAWNPK
jgi:hypothetical protein